MNGFSMLVAGTMFAAATLSVVAPAHAAGVYRWTDASGNVHYSDKRDVLRANRVTLETLQKTKIHAPRLVDDIPPSFVRTVRTRCETARERKAAYDQAGAVFDNTATGVTYQLDAARRAERLQELAADIRKYCARNAEVTLWAARSASARTEIPADAKRVPITGRFRLGRNTPR